MEIRHFLTCPAGIAGICLAGQADSHLTIPLLNRTCGSFAYCELPCDMGVLHPAVHAAAYNNNMVSEHIVIIIADFIIAFCVYAEFTDCDPPGEGFFRDCG